jgi:hypothetical protein
MSILLKKDINLIEFIKSSDLNTLLKGQDENGISYLKHIFRLHVILFGETCTGCPSNTPHYINKIKNVNLNPMEKKENQSLFLLKKGKVLVVPGTSIAYSEHNITDEIAIKLLRENPNRASLFQSLPKNLEELLNDEDHDKVEIDGNLFPVAEALELLKQVGVETKATTVNGISKKVEKLTDEELEKIKEILNSDKE